MVGFLFTASRQVSSALLKGKPRTQRDCSEELHKCFAAKMHISSDSKHVASLAVNSSCPSNGRPLSGLRDENKNLNAKGGSLSINGKLDHTPGRFPRRPYLRSESPFSLHQSYHSRSSSTDQFAPCTIVIIWTSDSTCR